MLLWKDEVNAIKEELVKGKTTQEIGEVYGVSRQRIYQVLTKFGLSTNSRHRKNFLVDKEPKYYWLNRMLCQKGVAKETRTLLLKTMVVPDNCPVLGLPLNYLGTGVSGFSRGDFSASIDRIDSDIGYKPDNICIISWRANRIKNNGTPEEHYKIYHYFTNLTKKDLRV